jgi:hypothetical protein
MVRNIKTFHFRVSEAAGPPASMPLTKLENMQMRNQDSRQSRTPRVATKRSREKNNRGGALQEKWRGSDLHDDSYKK